MSHHDEEPITPEEIRAGCAKFDKFLQAVEGKLFDRLSPDAQTVILGLRRIFVEVQQSDDETLHELSYQAGQIES
jgi:hypothetical protein